jgi:glycerol uptake facilitator-like aquaporin
VQVTLARRAVSELLGTAFLVAAVIGSGIMAQRLAGADVATALLANTIATGGALVALILTFGPISGAHFNPVVTAWATFARELPPRDAAVYVAAQIAGGLLGAIAANVMFDLAPLALSTHVRSTHAELFSEVIATFGLLGVIVSTSRRVPVHTPYAVAAYIVAAYWFTASTSFANPAVTIARTASNTFAGIRPADAPGFVAAQLAGGAAAALLFGWLVPRPSSTAT